MGRANWQDPVGQDEILVSVFVAEKKAGRHAENKWKKASYQAVVDAIDAKLGVKYTIDQVSNHWGGVCSLSFICKRSSDMGKARLSNRSGLSCTT
jgi:hypothetical protein